MKKKYVLVYIALLLTGCTYNITIVCGERNNAKQKMDVVKDFPISATIPLLK